MNHSAIDITEDVTYSQLVSLIGASKLFKGKSYRISDFATKHTIPTTAVLNTATVEPLIVTAEETNKLRPQAFSQAYPQDVIIYTTDSTFIPGADKGCIMYRWDTTKNISCYYDWRGVKFRDYGGGTGNWDPAGRTINGIAIATGATLDLLTFFNSADPSGTFNVHIGLKSPNDRLNNIVFYAVPATGSYARAIENVTFAGGCSEFRYVALDGTSAYSAKNISIGANSKRIFISSVTLDAIVESDVTDVLFSGASNFIGANSTSLYFSGTAIHIGRNCQQITITASFVGRVFFGPACSLINLLGPGTCFGLVFEASNSNITISVNLTSVFNSKFTAGVSYYNIDTTINALGIIGCTFAVANTGMQNYTIPAALKNLSFDMQSPDLKIWADTIDNTGTTRTAIKLQ